MYDMIEVYARYEQQGMNFFRLEDVQRVKIEDISAPHLIGLALEYWPIADDSPSDVDYTFIENGYMVKGISLDNEGYRVHVQVAFITQ